MVSSCGQGREDLTWVRQEVSPWCGLRKSENTLLLPRRKEVDGREWGQGSRCQKAGAQRRVDSGTDDMLHRDVCPWGKERQGQSSHLEDTPASSTLDCYLATHVSHA